MRYGEKVEGVYTEFRRKQGMSSVTDKRKCVTVRHISKNRILIEFIRAAPVVKSLTSRYIVLRAPDGRDLVKEWREVVQ